MIPILAQAENVPGDFIKDFALIVAAVAATAYYIKVLFWGEAPKTPQPFEVRAAKDYVHKEEFEQLAERVTNLEVSLVEKIDEVREHVHESEMRINASGEERAKLLHVRINDVLESVCEQRGILQQISRSTR